MNDVRTSDEMKEAIERRASGMIGGMLEQLADKLGGRANIAAVYGTPVERDGVTIIPVARVAWAFGAGGGSGNSPDGKSSGEGGGGGGGVTASPIGFIELRNGSAEFRPIRIAPPFWAIPPMIFAFGIAALLVMHGLRRLLRG